MPSYAERLIHHARAVSKSFVESGIDPRDSKTPAGIAHLEKIIPRECGDCTLCCSVYAIAAFDKPPGPACSEVCSTGCSIYEVRPDECKWYWCLWSMGAMDIDDSPLALNVAFDFEQPVQTIVHPHLVGWPSVIIRISEGSPGAARSGRAWEVVKELSMQIGCTIVTPRGVDPPEKVLVLRGELFPLEPYEPALGVRIYRPRGGRHETRPDEDTDGGPAEAGQEG